MSETLTVSTATQLNNDVGSTDAATAPANYTIVIITRPATAAGSNGGGRRAAGL